MSIFLFICFREGILPASQELCFCGHKSDLSESKNLEMLKCKQAPQTTKIVSKIAVEIFLHGHASLRINIAFQNVSRH
jgi:hypothetical protein